MWSSSRKRLAFADFKRRLEASLRWYDAVDLHYATTEFAPSADAIATSAPPDTAPRAGDRDRTLKSQQLQVATQVRQQARNVQTNQQRVQSTRASRQLAERKLEAEQRKFQAGTSTSFLVFQAQRDLSLARNNELRAILDYNQSVVDFETVQEVPIGAGGGGVTVTTVSTLSQPQQ